MPKIIILSEEDCDWIIRQMQRATVTSKRQRRLTKLFEKAPTEHTIRIVVDGGMVQDVENLPMGFNYEVQDFDVCDECGRVEPLCAFCFVELVRG